MSCTWALKSQNPIFLRNRGAQKSPWQRANAEPFGELLNAAESNTQIAIGEMAPSFGPFMPHKWTRDRSALTGEGLSVGDKTINY
jgi:hypothetical protein